MCFVALYGNHYRDGSYYFDNKVYTNNYAFGPRFHAFLSVCLFVICVYVFLSGGER